MTRRSDPMKGDTLFSFAEIPKRAKERQVARRTPIEDVRAMGSWTLDKLHVLELYLKIYVRVAGGGIYIDAFAGDGRLAVDGQLRDGSASIAVKSGAFARLFFIEKDPKRNSSLRDHLDATFSERISKKCQVLDPGDANEQIPDLLGSGTIDAGKPCFALLDPDSTQLTWRTVEHLARFKSHEPAARPRQCKVELWILFNTHQVMQRMWPADRRWPNPFAGTIDRVMGSRHAWEDFYRQGKPPTHLMQRYADLLRGLGYTYVDAQAIRDPASGRDQYHMIHASDHPAAVDFMTWARRASEIDQLRALALELPFPPEP